MGENSKIEWTDHTFNPWIGCTKVSEGCKFCYAETLMATRHQRVTWGPQGQRVRTSAANWRKPLAWDRKAARERRRYRVFCASLADVFEDYAQVAQWRHDLWQLIDDTPHLDWLLLTKRPENVLRMYDPTYWWDHVWIGASVENQEQADRRIPHLIDLPARVRFVSVEPLLGPVDLAPWLGGMYWTGVEHFGLRELVCEPAGLQWVIVGGESGAQARPMHPNWARRLRDECGAAGVPFFFKQHGEWLHRSQVRREFQGDLAMREVLGEKLTYHRWPDGTDSLRLGKKQAGRLLDEQEWSESPRTESEVSP